MLIVLAALAVGACGRGEPKQAVAGADSLQRDLQLAPVDTSKPLNDQPVATPAPEPAPRAAAPAVKPKPKPKPAAPAPTTAAAPAPAAAATPLVAAAGTHIAATMNDSISTAKNKVGDVVKATVASDVKDDKGRVVIPAGSTISIRITALHESENKSDKTGTLTLATQDISVNGKTYALDASIDDVARELVGRKTNIGDIAKVGAGTGIGAIVGRVIGGSAKGAIIGGVIGGAVGTQRAIETKDRDVVVPAGSNVSLTLRAPVEPQ
jgi:hypothetical protein